MHASTSSTGEMETGGFPQTHWPASLGHLYTFTHTHARINAISKEINRNTGQEPGNDSVVSGNDTHSRCLVFTEVGQISSTQCLQGCAHSRHSEFTLPMGTVVKIVSYPGPVWIS